MRLLTPSPTDRHSSVWRDLDLAERLRWSCEEWADHGMGSPVASYVFYALKTAIWALGWALFVTVPGDGGGLGDLGVLWDTPIAFQKAILWTLAWEAMGLGAGSGPLSGRMLPPFGGVLHFARPGITRLAPFSWTPLTGGHRRTVVDASLYVVALGLVFWILAGTDIGVGRLIALVAVIGMLGLRDKTVFLAARSEHYLATVVVFILATGDGIIAGSKAVQLAIWIGAASSKLNRHFPSVIAVMASNSPFTPARLRRAMYRDHPRDLRASRLAAGLAHAGTIIEFTFPVLLAFGSGGTVTTVGLVAMVIFHLTILSTVPMAVPIEWNVLFIYSGLVLFGTFSEVRFWEVGDPLLGVLLVIALVVVPVIGNRFPDRVSFLPSMRYYAGNWAFSMWLFRGDALDRLAGGITTVAADPVAQLARLYGPEAGEALEVRILGFRAMHLHLHDERLLAAVQAQCGFAPGDVRAIIVESQPAGVTTLAWRIVDAASGRLDEGEVPANRLEEGQPWATG